MNAKSVGKVGTHPVRIPQNLVLGALMENFRICIQPLGMDATNLCAGKDNTQKTGRHRCAKYAKRDSFKVNSARMHIRAQNAQLVGLMKALTRRVNAEHAQLDFFSGIPAGQGNWIVGHVKQDTFPFAKGGIDQDGSRLQTPP